MSDAAPEDQTNDEDAPGRRPTRAERRRTRRHEMAEVHHRRSVRRMFPNLVLSALIFFLIALIVTEQPLPLPHWARTELETRVNAEFDHDAFAVGGAAMSLGPSNGAQVRLRDIRVGTPDGAAAAAFNTLNATLLPGPLARGNLRPVSVSLDGAQVTLRRREDGSFSFAAGGGSDAVELSDLLSSLDAFLADNTFASLREVTAENVVIALEDARSGRIWQATGAQGVVRRSETGVTLSLTSDVFNGTDNVAEVQLSFAYNSERRDTSFGVRVADMAATDIAEQSPILAWLRVLDAPISGAVRAEVDGATGQTSLAGTLDIAAGALSPVEGSDPQPFDAARAYFSFDPERQRLNFSEVSVRSESLSMTGTGHTYLSELDTGWPSAFIGQFRVEEVVLDDDTIFPAPVSLTDVTTDLRLRLDPFTVDFGQISAPNDGQPVHARAHVEARSDGWSYTLDAETDVIDPETVLAFWPVMEARNTRRWLAQNVLGGQLTDVTAALRKEADAPLDYGVTFDIDDGLVQFLPDMPPISEGRGRATLAKDSFTLVLEEGGLEVPGGGRVDGSGSVLTIPDVDEKPTRGLFDIRAAGDLRDVLAVLDRRPLGLLDKIDRDIDFASGAATVNARLELPLIKDLPVEQVRYAVNATLQNARSDSLIPGRRLTSDRLALEVDSEAVVLSGPVALDGVPMTVMWEQQLDADPDAPSRATGRLRLTNEALAAFDVPLPAGTFDGAATAAFDLEIPSEGAPRLSLTSDLEGARLDLSSLGWRKSSGGTADFALNAVLTEPVQISSFSLDAFGLDIAGSASVTADGKLDALDLETLRVGPWLDASARVSLGGGSQRLALTGGRLDLRNLPDFNSRSDAGVTIDVALDQLIVTDDLRLGPFRGELTSGRLGLSGDFQGRLNGGSVVRAALAPTPNGTGVRIQSNDAGSALRDARLSPNANGGTMDIVMAPVGPFAPGAYNGEFLISNMALKDAPVMAALLDAVSVVGLLDQLSGAGIRFATIDGDFRLTPNRITFRDVAATGVSLGISANGVYDMAGERLDIEGVVSPFYFLNAVGNVVSRRGEGLFGFNYRVAGDVSRPRVSVNPLSILTPGAFRQIFRRPPPSE